MKIKLLGITQITVSALLPFGCTQRPIGRSTGGWDHMMGYGNYGGILTWLILVIFSAVVIYFASKGIKRDKNPDNPAMESPLDILKKRYARGEIRKEEFDRLKKDIET